MSTKNKVGLGILIALMVAFCLVLVWTIKGFGNKTGSAEDSVFVQQRIKILQQKGE
jgi:hypothetical protein